MGEKMTLEQVRDWHRRFADTHKEDDADEFHNRCADAIDAGNKNRLLELFCVQRKESAEAADFSEHFTAMRRGEHLRQSGFDFVSEIDVHAGGGVSFLFHVGR